MSPLNKSTNIVSRILQKSNYAKMPSAKLITNRLEKSDVDDRSYRIIELQNKLTALLIHDPTTDKAAASLDVNVGSFADFKYKIPGLAHLCEHLLFMGTSKYPKENEYSSYLSQNSGHSNAFTSAEHTNYHFEVNHEFLEGALDRFSQFFISPLFSKDCKDREIKAVDSENKKNLQNDGWRFSQVDKTTANPEHPYNGFSTGTFHSLNDEPAERGLDVRDVLIKFYNESYSANLMKLVIIGREDLDTLQNWSVSKFGDVKNLNLPIPSYDVPVFKENQLLKLVKIKPIMEARNMELVFMVPDKSKEWECQPGLYFSHLLGHEGPGSLFYFLKEKGWCTSLSSGNSNVCNGSGCLKIGISLTSEGFQNWDKILVNIFQHIKLLTEAKPQKWFWDELAVMSKTSFKFREKFSAFSTVSRLSSSLQKQYLPKEFILSSGVLRKWDPNQIEEFGRNLSMKNFRIFLSGPELTDLSCKEKWYGTEYSCEDISSDILSRIQNCTLNEALHLPIPNVFLPDNLDVIKPSVPTTPVSHPYLIKNSNASRIWFKKDDQFWVPIASVEALLHLPVTNKTVTNALLTSFFVLLLEDELNEISYYAEIAKLHLHISYFKDSLVIKLSGYNNKLPIFMSKVLDKLRNFKPKKDRFEVFKKTLEQSNKNFGFSVPYSQINFHVLIMLNENVYSHAQRLEALKNINYDTLVSFLGGIWQEHFKEIFIHGNVNLEEAKKISEIWEEKFNDVGIVSDKYSLSSRSYTLTKGETYRFETLVEDPKNAQSCIEYFIQLGEDNSNELQYVLTTLLSIIIDEPCFNQLRTKEQLGYVVSSGCRTTRTTFGIKILIQSERTTDYLEYRIEEFFSRFGKYVNNDLTDEAFEKVKDSFISMKSRKLKNLGEEFARFWSAISTGLYDFDFERTSVETAKQITKEQFIEFFNFHVLDKSTCGRLVVHLKSQVPPIQSNDKLVQASIANYLTKQSFTFSNDTIQTLIKTHFDSLNSNDPTQVISALVAELSSQLFPDLKSDFDIKSFEKTLLDVITRELVDPTPKLYSGGQLLTSVGQFKAMVKLNAAVRPIYDIEKFWHPDLLHQEAKL